MRKLYLEAIMGLLIAFAAIFIILGSDANSKFVQCNFELNTLYHSQNTARLEWQKLYGDMTYYHVLATESLLMAYVLDSYPKQNSTYFDDFNEYRIKQTEKWDPIIEYNNLLGDLSYDIVKKAKECDEYFSSSAMFSKWTFFVYVVIFILSVMILRKSKSD